MSSNKYLTNNNQLKKTTLNLFVPILFGARNNKLIKTFYYESMYYKNFYLIFNNLSLIEVFFKDKKIFYNFSKYFQFNLYIYLIKTNSIILNFFFHFFYTLFSTFENNEDIFTNKFFFRGYKERAKYKRISKGWVKPDYGFKFYFNKKINSISLYVLNFNIYKNMYLTKYNLFLTSAKFIYKLIYYFKMLQYKLHSFLIFYKYHFKVEKKLRCVFAKVNAFIYKNLNNKLIKLFSFYKLHLNIKKKDNLNLSLHNNNQIVESVEFKNYDKLVWTNSYRLYIIRQNAINAEKIAIDAFKKNKLKNQAYFDQELFDILFENHYFSEKDFDFLYKILIKLQWIRTILNKKDFCIGAFYFIFYKFLFSTNFFITCYLSNLPFIFRNLLNMFHHETMNSFIVNIFNVNDTSSFFNTLSKRDTETFINYIYNQTGFNLIISNIEFFFVHNFSAFYTNVIEVFEHFLDADFHSFFFYKHMDSMFKRMKKYYRLFPADSKKLPQTKYGKRIRLFLVKKYFKDRRRRVLNYILHQKLYKEHYIYDPENHHYHKIYKEDYLYCDYCYSHVFSEKLKYSSKSKISINKLFSLLKKKRNKQQKRFLLKILSKKFVKSKKNFVLRKDKINTIIDFFYKRKRKNIFLTKINSNKINLSKFLAFKNNAKFKAKYILLKVLKKFHLDKKKKVEKKIIEKINNIKKLLKLYNKQFFYATKDHLYDIAISSLKKINKTKIKFNKFNKKLNLIKNVNVLKKKIVKKLKKNKKIKIKVKKKYKKNKFLFFKRYNKKKISNYKIINKKKNVIKLKKNKIKNVKLKKKRSKKKKKFSFNKLHSFKYVLKYFNKNNFLKRKKLNKSSKLLLLNTNKKIELNKLLLKKNQISFDKFIFFKKNFNNLKKKSLFNRFKNIFRRRIKKVNRKKKILSQKKIIKLSALYRKFHKLKSLFLVKNKKPKILTILGQKKNYKLINWSKFFLFLHYFTLIKRKRPIKLYERRQYARYDRVRKYKDHKSVYVKKTKNKVIKKNKYIVIKNNNKKKKKGLKKTKKIKNLIKSKKLKTNKKIINKNKKIINKNKKIFRKNQNNIFNKNKNQHIKKKNKYFRRMKRKKNKLKIPQILRFFLKTKNIVFDDFYFKNDLSKEKFYNALTQKGKILLGFFKESKVRKYQNSFFENFRRFKRKYSFIPKSHIRNLNASKFSAARKFFKMWRFKLKVEKRLRRKKNYRNKKWLFKKLFMRHRKIFFRPNKLNIRIIKSLKEIKFKTKFENKKNNSLIVNSKYFKLNTIKSLIIKLNKLRKKKIFKREKEITNLNKNLINNKKYLVKYLTFIINKFNTLKIKSKNDLSFFKKSIKLIKLFINKKKFIKLRKSKILIRKYGLKKKPVFVYKNFNENFYKTKFFDINRPLFRCHPGIFNLKSLKMDSKVSRKLSSLTLSLKHLKLSNFSKPFMRAYVRRLKKKAFYKSINKPNKKIRFFRPRFLVKKKLFMYAYSFFKKSIKKKFKKSKKCNIKFLKSSSILNKKTKISIKKIKLLNKRLIKIKKQIIKKQKFKDTRSKFLLNKLKKRKKLYKHQIKLLKLKYKLNISNLKKIEFLNKNKTKLFNKLSLKLEKNLYKKVKNRFLKKRNKKIKINILTKIKTKIKKAFDRYMEKNPLPQKKKTYYQCIREAEEYYKRKFFLEDLAQKRPTYRQLLKSRKFHKKKKILKKLLRFYSKLKLKKIKKIKNLTKGLKKKKKRKLLLFFLSNLKRKSKKKRIEKSNMRIFYNKYTFFFKILLKTRLKLFKIKNTFNFLFLDKLKVLIKNILFKTKNLYYPLASNLFNKNNFYNEYKLWFLHYKDLKKIPFKLIYLYSKFYFNKLLYNFKLQSNFFMLYNNYLQARTKVKYFNIKQSNKSLKKKKIKTLFQIMFYNVFRSYMNYFISPRKVIFSFIKNGSFYMYYKMHETSRKKIKALNSTISFFFQDLKKKRSFYVSKYIRYTSFFFVYWVKKYYNQEVYGHYRQRFSEFHLLSYYFKFFKSKTFFFNYLINFVFTYIQKVNLNILNYIFVLNQYKTKLVIESNNFYKYLLLFYFKKNHYINFNNQFNYIIPSHFSYFSIFFKQLSLELINWYSIVNNSFNNGYKSTFLFNLCFVNHNTMALYLHYKYKYLYYYRVYSFYIFYIFYYLYNHLYKVYIKLKLKDFKLTYDLIKYNEYNRYYLGLRTRMLILTIRNRYKRGFTVENIFRSIKYFLRESMKKKELAGYYISIRGRYKRSSRSNKLIIKNGVYSFNKIDLKVDSSYGTLNTKYGIAGIKVIFAFK